MFKGISGLCSSKKSLNISERHIHILSPLLLSWRLLQIRRRRGLDELNNTVQILLATRHKMPTRMCHNLSIADSSARINQCLSSAFLHNAVEASNEMTCWSVYIWMFVESCVALAR